MNLYLIKSKVDLINEAKRDFKLLYGEECEAFTQKLFFYFIISNGKKYIHKRALNFVYTNADTYTDHVDPYFCNLSRMHVPNICQFLETTTHPLLPRLVDSNQYFLVFDHVEGSPVDHINREEFFTLKQAHLSMNLTPFYNSMTYNIVRNVQGLRLIDFKHFEEKDEKPFFVYMYNKDNNINTLYMEEGVDDTAVIKHIARDYPTDSAVRRYF